jgi:hypothetical protein
MPLGDAASSPLEQQEALRRRADEASAELDNLRHANQHLQELVQQIYIRWQTYGQVCMPQSRTQNQPATAWSLNAGTAGQLKAQCRRQHLRVRMIDVELSSAS